MTRMTILRRGLLFFSTFLMLSGCLDREGELVTHWIVCSKNESGKWVSPSHRVSSRFEIVTESRYQVSFLTQRVVSSTGIELKKCTVYDIKNWTCEDIDGSLFIVTNGEKALSCGGGACYLSVGLIPRVKTILGGTKEIERICNDYSFVFEAHQKRKQWQR